MACWYWEPKPKVQRPRGLCPQPIEKHRVYGVLQPNDGFGTAGASNLSCERELRNALVVRWKGPSLGEGEREAQRGLRRSGRGAVEVSRLPFHRGEQHIDEGKGSGARWDSRALYQQTNVRGVAKDRCDPMCVRLAAETVSYFLRSPDPKRARPCTCTCMCLG